MASQRLPVALVVLFAMATSIAKVEGEETPYERHISAYRTFLVGLPTLRVAWSYEIANSAEGNALRRGKISARYAGERFRWEEARWAIPANGPEALQYRKATTWDGKENRFLDCLSKVMMVKDLPAIPSAWENPLFLPFVPFSPVVPGMIGIKDQKPRKPLTLSTIGDLTKHPAPVVSEQAHPGRSDGGHVFTPKTLPYHYIITPPLRAGQIYFTAEILSEKPDQPNFPTQTILIQETARLLHGSVAIEVAKRYLMTVKTPQGAVEYTRITVTEMAVDEGFDEEVFQLEYSLADKIMTRPPSAPSTSGSDQGASGP